VGRDSKKFTLEFYNNYENSNKKLIKILDEFYGIDNFLYQRVYWNGRYFFLGQGGFPNAQFNYIDFYIDYIKKPTKLTIKILTENKAKSYFLSNNVAQENEREFYKPLTNIIKQSGCRESFNFVKSHANYYECSSFCISKSSLVTNKFLYENTMSLQEFINYFKLYNYDAICKAESLITTKFEATELLQLQRNLNARSIQEEFISKLKQSSGERTFSPREIECIFLVKEGLSYKEIALKLKVSLRTIEHHIENIKLKTGLSFKNEIRDIL
jgi:DNA-binding CsgD family transcriptional regulator